MRWRVTTAFARFTATPTACSLTVKGTPCADESNPKFGMVMDFGELKRIVNEQILSRLDHAFVMRRTAESTRVAEQIGCRFGRIVLVD